MKPLPHHENRDDLRRQLLDASRDYFPNPQLDTDPVLRIAFLLGSAYAYNLAAAVQWVALNVGEEAADGLARWLSESLVNGDDEGLNEDLESRPATA